MFQRVELTSGSRSTNACRPIDPHAVRIPQMSGLEPCLYIPIAARNTLAIETYVGRILAPLASQNKALLIESREPEKPDERLAIWNMPQSSVLHYPQQVWVKWLRFLRQVCKQ